MVDTTFIDKLASADPTPGGGGACAYCGALAAALGSMVGNLTVGKPKYAQVEERVKETLGELEALRVRLLELIDEDARAFAPLAAAYGMPRSTPEELAEQHITPTTVRLSIGVEHIDDIIADLDQAFAKI